MRFILFFLLLSTFSYAQTTDLAISVEAQDTNGNSISQAHIYERYNYLITISNTGNAVTASSFNFDLSTADSIEAAVAQNATGGAVNPATISIVGNTVSGDLPSMPTASSIEILVSVRAATDFLGGATITATVDPPAGTTDINTSSNTSVISIILTDFPIDFQITQSQITPAGGAGISMWGDTVTYEFTILNNSTIEFPLSNIAASLSLANNAGTTNVELLSIDCISANGMNCIPVTALPTMPFNLIGSEIIIDEAIRVDYPAGASTTFRASYRVDQGDCSSLNPNVPLQIAHNASIELELPINSTNRSPLSARTVTALLLNDECVCTDLSATVQILSPAGPALSSWNDIVTYEMTITNNGPVDITAGAFLTNTSTLGADVDILSVTCTGTTGSLNCSDITLNVNSAFRWFTNPFLFPVGSTATFITTLRFIEPDCTPAGAAPLCNMRGVVFIDQNVIDDCVPRNNFQDDSIEGLPATPCIVNPSSPIIELTEVQTIPAPGAGPYPYGDISYEIIMKNVDTLDHRVKFKDIQNSPGTGILQSIVCTGTTNMATCPTALNDNIGVANSAGDTFWEILDTDNFIIPAGGTITFEKVINWTPPCSTMVEIVQDGLTLTAIDDMLIDIEAATASVATPMVPCVDIVVQTFPSITASTINQNLEWVVDITNSNISDTAINLSFTDVLNPQFTITGTPTCALTNGTASCITSFNVAGNTVTGMIPSMEPNSTIQVRIPVTAPSFGGSFENIAQAQPDFTIQGENTPASNISISSLFVRTNTISKTFNPVQINIGGFSTLTFTITNSNGSPAQQEIRFTDTLPAGVILVGNSIWVNQNGATGTFINNLATNEVGIQDLSFPAGTDSVSFSVLVTGLTAGLYANDFSNFSNLNNTDASGAFATLEVIPELDIAISKTVDNEQPELGDTVIFTINLDNIGSATATSVMVTELLPAAYRYISHTTSIGTYDVTTALWDIGTMAPDASAQLTLEVEILENGLFTNRVVARSDNTTFTDVNLENNTATASTLSECLSIPEGFSPNGDGTNDLFVIDCIELYPNNELTVFNRYGVAVYKASGYLNDWDGKPNDGPLHDSSKLLPVGTYYYHLDLGNGDERTVSWLYINY